MRNGYIGLTILGTIAMAMPGLALAQTCPPGQILQAGICRPATPPVAAAPAAPSIMPQASATTARPTTAPPPAAAAEPSASPHATTVTTTTRAPMSGTTAPPPPAMAPAASAEKIETCPAGLALYNHGCYPAHDAMSTMGR